MGMQISSQGGHNKTEGGIPAQAPPEKPAGQGEEAPMVLETLKAIEEQGKSGANPREKQLPEGSLEKIGQGIARLQAEAGKAMEAMIPIREDGRTEKKDLVQLSRENMEQMDAGRWEREAELAAWKTLLEWLPVQGEDLPHQAKELTERYLQLLEDILAYVPTEQQSIYTEKLRQILVSQLDALIKISIPELKNFFKAYGMENSIPRLRKSMYFAVTGSYLSLETVKNDWDAVSRAGKRYFLEENRTASASDPFFEEAASEEAAGSTYSKVRVATKQMAATGSAQMLLDAARNPRHRTMGQGEQGKPERIYPIRDMQKAEQFIRALGGTKDNLFATRSFTAKNEALYGVLWIMEKSKTELFVNREMASSPLKQDIETSVERMITAYMRNAVMGTATDRAPRNEMLRFSQERAYEIYRYAMKRYHGGGTVNKAIRDGFYYALKYFLQSKEGVEGGESHSGFFQEFPEKASLKQDLEKGGKLLEEDWKQFLSEMGYDDELLQLTASLYGPWAMLIRPEDEKQERLVKKGEALAIAGGLAAIAILVVMGILFF